MEKILTFCNQPMKVACDEKCNKAWGMNNRPRVYPEISDTLIFGLNGEGLYFDEDKHPEVYIDNYAYCSDDELGEAPIDPLTYEGDDAKPTNKDEIGNKWCIRECERCVSSDIGKSAEPLELINLEKRFYNCSPHTRD